MPRSVTQAKPGDDLRPGWWRSGWVAGCAAVLAVAVLATHAGKYPHFAGFWAGVDQQRYLAAARAWAAGDLAPAHHHYLPLYPLMGAAFVWLTPWQPFMVPDLLCLVGSLLLFVRIGARLAPGWPPAAGAACFVAAVMGGKMLLGLWIVPWSSTGSAPFQFGALLLALRFGERPGAARAAWLGLAIALIAGFRPSDAAVLLATCGVYGAGAIGWNRLRIGRMGGVVLAGIGGFAGGIAAIAGLHGLIFGLAAGPYIAESSAIGFEWRLLPIRWVMLVIDPRPLLPEGTGIAEHFPWIVPGLAGLLLACVTWRGRAWAAQALAGGTVALHWALYLAYRDMHSYGLWRFYNIHYFKWTFPFLVLWAAQWLAALRHARRRPVALAALAATLLLFAWRPILRKPAAVAIRVDGQHLMLPRAPREDEALLLPVNARCGDSCAAAGRWTAIYFARTTLAVGGRTFVTKRDTKLLPVAGGALLVTLRPVPGGPAVLELPGELGIDAGKPVDLFRQAVVFGVPCLGGC